MSPILFLDFDGVLHSEPSLPSDALSQLPLVESVLREFPAVEIVISSSWRLDWTKEAEAVSFLRLHFSADIALRVAGVTPDCSYLARPQLGEEIPLRQYECMEWLKANRTAGTPWLALDDRDDWFLPGCLNLMAVDRYAGFESSDAAEFRRHLANLTQN